MRQLRGLLWVRAASAARGTGPPVGPGRGRAGLYFETQYTAIARRKGISVAALVRQSVDRVLLDESRQPAAQYERAATLVGAFADREGAKDLSRRHDDHLRETYE